MIFNGARLQDLKMVLRAAETIGRGGNVLALAGRALLSVLFINEGVVQIGDVAGTMDYVRGFGVWPQLVPLVILVELGGGLLVLFGLATRVAAIGLAVFTLLAALFFHRDFSDLDQYIHFQKNLAIAGGFLALAAYGAGAWSLDAWLAKRAWKRGLD
ncbi:MAG TPA: DoxX family protein [Roseiarcus sp.]|nr:DoxX family protein [Roseiarcus sp.]